MKKFLIILTVFLFLTSLAYADEWDGLLECFSFDDISGTTYTGNTNSFNATVYGTGGVNTTDCISNDCYSQADAIGNYIRINDSLGNAMGTPNSAFSFMLWFKPSLMDDAGGHGVFSISGHDGANRRVENTLSTSDNIGTAGDIGTSNSLDVIFIDNWYHFIMVYNGTGNNLTHYVNGTVSSRGAGVGTVNLAGLKSIIGDYYSSGVKNNYEGNFDEFCIWNRSLKPEEALQLYNDGGISYSEVIPECDYVICTNYISCQPDITGGYQNCTTVNETGECVYSGNYSEFQVWCNYCTKEESTASGECDFDTGLRPITYQLTNNETCCGLTGNSTDCNVTAPYTEACGYVQSYGAGEISETAFDILIGTIAVIFAFSGIIALVLIFVWASKKWKR